LRIKEQDTCLTLQEHDDVDDDSYGMATSKECLQSGGIKGCWIGYRIGEGKGEGLGEPGERTYMQKWN